MTKDFYVADPLNITNATCSISSPPETLLPEGYRSYPILGETAISQGVDNYSTYDWYDIYVEQPIPWVISTSLVPSRFSGVIHLETKVVCVAPNSPVKGSRIPELQFSPRQEEDDNQEENNNEDQQNAASSSCCKRYWLLFSLLIGFMGAVLLS